MKTRHLAVAVLAGLLAALYAAARWGPRGDAGDLYWPICAARRLTDPYQCVVIWRGVTYPSNPLTTALALWPLASLPMPLIAVIFSGLMYGLLAWGLLATGERWRLLALLSAPSLSNLYLLNWAALVLAAWYVRWLWPVALLIKPHTALPVALLRWRRWPRGIAIVAGVGLLSLAVRPSWPAEFIAATGGYTGRPALLSWWGPPLLLALLRWRSSPTACAGQPGPSAGPSSRRSGSRRSNAPWQ